MKQYEVIYINITAKDKDAKEIIEFRKKNPKVTHLEVYLKGLETFK